MSNRRFSIPVEIPGSAYAITVEPGLLQRAGLALAALTGVRKAAVVTDSNIAPLHLATLLTSFQAAGFHAVTATIPAGEPHKTIHHLLPVYDQFLSAKIERATPVVALGGGVIGDMAGFVAATILRGVPFVQVPTSLLAMVDASVGGKTGIDHPCGKNLIGAFHQPMAVLIDPEVLRTLPPRELRSGLAECIKHDIIRDVEGFARLEQNIGRALDLDIEYLAELVAHNVGIKAKVVAADPFEKGERAHLNLGHTFGHAIETISNYSYAHGEAVGLGICAAAFASRELGLLSEADRQRILAVIGHAGLPTGGLTLDIDAVVNAMAFDKKVKAGKVRFILPDGIGRATIRDDVPMDLVRRAVGSLR